MSVISLMLLAVLVALSVFAPMVWGDAAALADPGNILAAPAADHLLGTDALGRDILLRTLVATRLSIGMALVATAAGTVAGLAIGALPVILGRRAQRGFGAVINTWLAFPVLLVAMLVVILLGASAETAVIALALTMTPGFARLAQTLSSRVGGSEYLAAARMIGVSPARQLTRYILPNIAEPIIVNVTISIGGGLLAISSLSFLGVGVQPPQFDWGRLLNEGFTQVYSAPAAALGPGVAVIVAGITFGMLGEVLAGSLRNRSGNRAKSAPSGAAPGPDSATPATADSADYLLHVDGLSVAFPSDGGWIHPVRDVSFSLRPGEIVGIVGESGSGKSVSMMALAGLAAPGAVVTARSARFRDADLLALHGAALGRALGTDIGVVFQDSLTALNPAMRVGAQLEEIPRFHSRASRARAHQLAVAALDDVGIPDAEASSRQYPHEFSGGMRQRVLIAMAQIGNPALIIADEPTTALDVTVQRRVLAGLRRRSAETGAATIMVSHDIAVLAELCQRILVMYGGRIVEDVDVRLLAEPEKLAHPYTRALAASLPDLATDRSQPLATILGEPMPLTLDSAGCRFANRCAFATDVCSTSLPPLASHAHGGRVACWHPQDDQSTALNIDEWVDA